MDMTTVSFPGLGIDEFSFSRIAFHLFGKPVYWYGVIILLGIIAAFAHALWRSRREGVSKDDLLDLAIFIILFGVLGARLYYVATTWGNYHSFLDVIAIWNGGLAIYGGVIAGAITILVVCRFKKLNPLRVMDMIAPGVMLGQAIGRWGNFCNGEAYGEVVPENSWLYPFRMGLRSSFTGSEMQYYHPTFLYESVWNIVGFILITLTYKHKKFNGQILLSYLTWYGFGRMFIEGLRTDSLYVGSLRISQVVGLVCFVVGGVLLIAGFLLHAKGKLSSGLFGVTWYPPIYKAATAGADTAGADTAGTEEAGVEAQDDGIDTPDTDTAADSGGTDTDVCHTDGAEAEKNTSQEPDNGENASDGPDASAPDGASDMRKEDKS